MLRLGEHVGCPTEGPVTRETDSDSIVVWTNDDSRVSTFIGPNQEVEQGGIAHCPLTVSTRTGDRPTAASVLGLASRAGHRSPTY